MQLFITPFVEVRTWKKSVWDFISLYEKRVTHQVKHVLRGKIWMNFFVQPPYYAAELSGKQIGLYRYLVELIDIKNDELVCKVVESIEEKIEVNSNKLCVALPNKFEKIELIVQKVTELWMQQVLFFPSERSQIHELSENKIKRAWKIALEATEQSFGFLIPHILFENNIRNVLSWWTNIVFHQEWEEFFSFTFKKNNWINFFVWPEWWRSNWDEKIFNEYDVQKFSLWKNILRTETASIIVAREATK